MVTNKQIGTLVIVLSIAFLITLISLTLELRESTVCPIEMEEPCPHESYIPPQTFFGGIIITILIVTGIFLMITKESKIEKIDWKKYLKGLEDNEKKIYKIIMNSDGVILQSDLVKNTGFSKVKVTRILDKLEAKGLLERKRRGMSNIVILKRK
ncbi:MAG: helix-turn-helix transcriptional regulator [Candidatus Aenigmatarchaeota archaeon]